MVFDREAQARRDDESLRTTFRQAVQVFGGLDPLRAALGEKESYLSKLSEALTGGKPIQARWFLPLLDDPASAAVLLGWMCQRAGFEAPVTEREISEEDVSRAARAVLAEMGPMAAAARAEVARRLGVPVERVRL